VSDPRHILITGASRGIGRALACHYLDAGDLVFGCSRGASDLVHDRYAHFAVDVGDEDSVDALFKELRGRTGTLDVLINNAGAASMNPIVLMPAKKAREIIEINLLGTFLMTHAATRLLRRSRAGRIVNVSTVAVPLRLEGEAVYAASKSGVETFTRITAQELGPFGITCNAIGPSAIKTRLTQGVSDEQMQALIDRQAIRRGAEVSDVVNVVDFFLRPESQLVTGQVIYLGGIG
jgi:3-oxoacyl-[acyl-carrier protein] reductase